MTTNKKLTAVLSTTALLAIAACGTAMAGTAHWEQEGEEGELELEDLSGLEG